MKRHEEYYDAELKEEYGKRPHRTFINLVGPYFVKTMDYYEHQNVNFSSRANPTKSMHSI